MRKSIIDNRGFTLIEWLAIISLIVILTISLVLALEIPKKHSRDSKRLADLKTLQKAIELYKVDHDSSPPPVYTWSGLETALKKYLPGGLPKDPAGRLWCYCVKNYPNRERAYLIATTLEQTVDISNDLDEGTLGSTNPFFREQGMYLDSLGDYKVDNDCICNNGDPPDIIDCRDDVNGGIVSGGADNSGSSTDCLGKIPHRARLLF